ncbi:hypothetical protein CMV_007315 [Castanea mollissima]|uniref:Uncharacterized protein n=1 Tax=Castanea mollissima TaxID=60419 RepID=A0A8J4R993_9ROSI|nr:hypothetical protein CMV_007315 [Castanea mollissima]
MKKPSEKMKVVVWHLPPSLTQSDLSINIDEKLSATTTGKKENATKFYKGFRSANQKQFEDRDRLLQKTNPYLAEEISDSNHPQRIKCNKKAKSICRTRRRNLITRKSLVSS